MFSELTIGSFIDERDFDLRRCYVALPGPELGKLSWYVRCENAWCAEELTLIYSFLAELAEDQTGIRYSTL